MKHTKHKTHEGFIHSLVFSLKGRAWQELEPSHVTGMALAHCILGKFLGVVCHCFPPHEGSRLLKLIEIHYQIQPSDKELHTEQTPLRATILH